MAEINFYLKDTKAKQDTPINLVFLYNAQKLKYSIGKKINPTFWDSKKQRAKATPKFPFSTEFNQEINDWQNETNKIFKRYIEVEKCYPSLEQFREELDIYKGVKLPKAPVVQIKPTLEDFFNTYISERKNLLKGKAKIYGSLLSQLKNYRTHKKKPKIDFDDITLDFLYDFVKYQYEIQDNSPSYVAKLISSLRTVLREAEERNYHQSQFYKSQKFVVPQPKIHKIYLSEAELCTFIDFNLENNERLDKVRDTFILSSYTGLRYSDYIRIKPEHISVINGRGFITINTKKTGQKVVVPIHPYVGKIFDKYKGDLPKITNQKLNEYVKELGEVVGLITPTDTCDYKGGKRNDYVVPKYELISSHTGRRSFATNTYKSNMPVSSIMAILGHTTEKQFFNYIKISIEESALKMAEHSFFN